jgi:hypothetical protein
MGLLAAACLFVTFKGQPAGEERWALVAAKEQALLDARRVFVDPAEVVELKKDQAVYVRILDLRPESDYDLFHLSQSTRVALGDLTRGAVWRAIQSAPENTVFFVVASGEALATRAFKVLRGMGVPNVYIIAGGINGWLAHYHPPICVAEKRPTSSDDEPGYAFRYAVGDRIDAARPESLARWPAPCEPQGAAHTPTDTTVAFERKVQLQRKAVVKGGCG